MWSLSPQQRLKILTCAAKAASTEFRDSFSASLDALRDHARASNELLLRKKVSTANIITCADDLSRDFSQSLAGVDHVSGRD